MQKMTDGERLIWAAAYANALSWPGEHSVAKATYHAHMAVESLRKAHWNVPSDVYQEPHVERSREMLDLPDD